LAFGPSQRQQGRQGHERIVIVIDKPLFLRIFIHGLEGTRMGVVAMSVFVWHVDAMLIVVVLLLSFNEHSVAVYAYQRRDFSGHLTIYFVKDMCSFRCV
jgi:hypothetical protein